MSEKKTFYRDLKDLIAKYDTGQPQDMDGVLLNMVKDCIKVFEFNLWCFKLSMRKN